MANDKDYHYLITIPPHRLDLQTKEDLVEEIVKIYGYENIPSLLPENIPSLLPENIPSLLPILENNFLVTDKENNWKSLIRQYLTSQGFQEIITYSLISTQKKKHFCNQDSDNSFYQLLTPKSENHVFYRHSSLSNHLETIYYNLSHKNNELLFFEISDVYYQELGNPRQEKILVISGAGKVINSLLHQLAIELDYFWLKGIIEGIFAGLNIDNEINFSPASLKEFHPYQSAEIFLQAKKIGFLGKINSEKNKEYQINQPTFVAQISLTQLFSHLLMNSQQNYQFVSPFPIVERDLSFFIEREINATEIIKVIKENGNEFLRKVQLIDSYESKEYQKKNQKSLTFRFTFQSSKKTLLSQEVDEIIKRITTSLESSFKAQIRE